MATIKLVFPWAVVVGDWDIIALILQVLPSWDEDGKLETECDNLASRCLEALFGSNTLR